MNIRRLKKTLTIIFGAIMLMLLSTGFVVFLLYNGFIRFNYPSFAEYPIQGIDVSNHQKEIDWVKLDKQRVQFAFIKSTEGGDFKDKSFERNWQEARKSNVVVGAYHFFTFCKSPEEQARNFIESVPLEQDMLPPAIDLEYSGNCKLTKTKEALLSDIETFVEIVEAHYQRKMIFYVTDGFYKNILDGKFAGHKFWIRDVYRRPVMSDDRTWVFWQFSAHGRLDGIDVLVDLNAFGGTKAEFDNLLHSRIEN